MHLKSEKLKLWNSVILASLILAHSFINQRKFFIKWSMISKVKEIWESGIRGLISMLKNLKCREPGIRFLEKHGFASLLYIIEKFVNNWKYLHTTAQSQHTYIRPTNLFPSHQNLRHKRWNHKWFKPRFSIKTWKIKTGFWVINVLLWLT